MENKHSLGIISITGSKLLERFSYYGMRSMLLLYMLHTLNFSEEKMHSIYGTFSLIIGLTPLIGGIIGDLVLGSKRAAILGGFIQALGYFALCIPNNIGLYSGLGFIILGVGLYNPNILSQLSLVYRNKHHLIDSAILILYVGINIGAFIAPFLIGTTGENRNYSTSFLLAGIAVCLSQVILIFTKNSPETILPENKTSYKNTNLITLVLISLFLTIPLYWILFEHSDFIILKLFNNINMDLNSNSFTTTTQMINPFIIIFLGIILAVIWSFIKVSSVLKLSIGFIITAISCFLISHFISSPTITFILLSIVL